MENSLIYAYLLAANDRKRKKKHKNKTETNQNMMHHIAKFVRTTISIFRRATSPFVI